MDVAVHNVKHTDIKYGYLASWLEACASDHSHTCNRAKKSDSPLQLYALDCLTKAVVPILPDDKYVALSYVWGEAADLALPPQLPSGDAPDSIWPPSDIPLTIKDSIEVTKNTGYRYLWVDRYCIPQVDESQRHEAIANMHYVYAGAEFTIIALDGDTVHAGLHGVSTTPRSEIQDILFTNSRNRWDGPPLRSLIDTSVWTTRGWTFQELRLSRRCLFFSDYRVFFTCSEVTISEAMPRTSTRGLARFADSGYNDEQAFEPAKAWHRGIFLDRLKYTRKTLKYQADILDAFRGIIGLHPFVTLWGVPITCVGWPLDPCVGFAMGLLWTKSFIPSEPSGRRPGFPTWSWTSLLGPISQYELDKNHTDEQANQDRFGESEYVNFLKGDLGVWGPSMKKLKPAIKVEIPGLGETLAEKIENTKSNILPESSTSIIVEGDILRFAKARIRRPNMAWFHFLDTNGNMYPYSPLNAQVDVSGPGVQPAATMKTLKGVQDALVIVEWSDRQPETEVRFVLMLLRWVGDKIAERVGLVGEYSTRWDKNLVNSLPRRRVKFELR